MENKLHALWMYIKHSRLLRILFFALLAIGVILYCLSHIPLTKSMRYDMQGYIVSTDGEILEEFTFTITGKDYNFIIDPKGGEIGFTGDKLTVLERDALIFQFQWNLASINKVYSFGHLVGQTNPKVPSYTYGTLSFYNKALNQYDWEPAAMLDLENGTFCMYSEHLASNAYIIGVTDPDMDPTTLITVYQDLFGAPKK